MLNASTESDVRESSMVFYDNSSVSSNKFKERIENIQQRELRRARAKQVALQYRENILGYKNERNVGYPAMNMSFNDFSFVLFFYC